MIGKELRVYREVNTRARDVLLRGFPKDLLNIIAEHRSYIAGGAISAVFDMRRFDEYDIFSMSEDHAKVIANYMDHNKDYSRVCDTNRAITYQFMCDSGNEKDAGCVKRVQIIFMNGRYGPPEDVIRKCDFRACMGAYDPATDQFVYTEGFKEDNKERRLVYNVNALFPLSSLLRVAKYTARGYTISRAEILNIGVRINQLEIYDTIDLVEEACAEGYDSLDDTQFDTEYLYQVVSKPKPRHTAFTQKDDKEEDLDLDLPF